jgi:protein-tyrosine-phosphatase
MVKEADLVITTQPEQKEELISLYPRARAKVFAMKEMSKWDGRFFF